MRPDCPCGGILICRYSWLYRLLSTLRRYLPFKSVKEEIGEELDFVKFKADIEKIKESRKTIEKHLACSYEIGEYAKKHKHLPLLDGSSMDLVSIDGSPAYSGMDVFKFRIKDEIHSIHRESLWMIREFVDLSVIANRAISK